MKANLTNYPDVSICIVTYKRLELLSLCLKAVKKTVKTHSYEILVCDNASGDGTVEFLEKNHPDVRVYLNPTNFGFAAANNKIIRISRGRVILLLNNDCVVTEGAIDSLVDFLDGQRDIGIVGPRILLPNGIIQPSFQVRPENPLANLTFIRFSRAKRQERILSSNKEISIKKNTMKEFIREQGYDRDLEVSVVIGACILVRRDFIDECGLMDERYFMYREDSDWCLRARRAGWKVFYCHDATVYHHHVHRTAKSEDLASFLEPSYYQSQLIFCRDYNGLFLTYVLAVSLSFLAMVRLFVGAISLIILKNRNGLMKKISTQVKLVGLILHYIVKGTFKHENSL